MKTLLTKSIAIGFFMASGNTELYAQGIIPKYELGITAGTFIYQGDLAPQRLGSLKTPTLAFNIFISRIVSPSFSLRTNLASGKLKGDESRYSSPAYRQQRNFSFKTPIIELSELVAWNILANNYENGKKVFSSYIMAGAGLSYLKIKRDWSNLNENYFASDASFFTGLNADAAHSLPSLIPVIPVGGGVRYAISQKLSVSAEMIYRFTFTDYIDGFSQSVNPDRNDHYYSVTAGLVYRLGVKNKLNCPTIRN